MYRVFISYPQEHLAWATHLKAILTAPGVAVYVAEYDLPPGMSLSAEISNRISCADLFVLLWSDLARCSQYVSKEIFTAFTSGKAIIPILLEQGVALPEELGDMKALDVTWDQITALQRLQGEVNRRAHDKSVGQFVAGSLVAFAAWAALTGKAA